MKTDFVICIPARYQSTRLPGKPLIQIKGKPLIQWAIESANKLGALEVVVATDDKRIFDFVESLGQKVVMTQNNHQSGTDRIAECAQIMNWPDETLVLNYQGDEPLVPKENINAVLQLFEQHDDISIGTLYQEIKTIEDVFNPNLVKIVTETNGKALFFSRAPIPWSQHLFNHTGTSELPEHVSYKHHIGLYVYRVSFLKDFSLLPQTELERVESLEQLRALSTGHKIATAKALLPTPHGIDTPEDIVTFEKTIQ
ncbi:3-deoxy-manno-octulosonate cytidylyltransferase [Marinicella rhabdoformis]|uniref:3-deoxy-manno-octulosonate cytidylyltransferase n=1 Tax=Marinicella rhabdoformis TaxID=2580566 RepID=UPI0012AEBEEF|nr:3-deoxy-manno-octulosonate cytidylyltransferase [Marinicella rhabdoformis]